MLGYYWIRFITCSLPLTLSRCQSISIDWQSVTNVSAAGLMFSPVDEQALFLMEASARSSMRCALLCHSTPTCRIFDFDDQSRRCRIFEGDIGTMGCLVSSISPQSRVGSLKYSAAYFAHRGQPCSFCEHSRYLTCVSGTCQCYPHSFFDGSLCQSQKLMGAACNTTAECRTDLNYTCPPSMTCARKYLAQRI
jgi:hypothetical protein